MKFAWLRQQWFGGISRIRNARVRYIDTGQKSSVRLGLTAEHLKSLLSGETPVIVCRQAISPPLCESLSERLGAESFQEWRLGEALSDYTKLGYTKTDVMIQEGRRMAAGVAAPERYLQRATGMRELLAECAPGLLEELSSEIDGLPGFACRPELCPVSGRPFLPCVVRNMVSGARRQDGNVHMDTRLPGRTISLNAYLRVPGSGGELVLYPVRKDAWHRFLNAHFFSTLEVQNFYPDRDFYTAELLKDIEPLVHRPAVGDVVFLDPAYPHAVRDFDAPAGFQRLSVQTFMQVSKAGSTQVLEYAV